MKNLLQKMYLVQLIILIIFYIISHNLNNIDNNTLNKNDEYYIFLKNIVLYNKVTNKYLKYLKNNKKIIFFDNEILLKNNDYFYIFYNKYNIFVYFFKEKNTNIHNIYFNGINNKKDLKILIDIVINVISNKLNFKYIENIIEKSGELYKLSNNNIENIIFLENNILKMNTLMNSFEYIFNTEYFKDNINNEYTDINDNIEKINLNINGYSLGGVFSQVFLHILNEKYSKLCNKLNIQMYNIESWFGGNKEDFDNFTKKFIINNIYNKKSIFYFYNYFFQSYFNNNILIDNNNNNSNNNTNNNDYEIIDILKESNKISPFGIINYINKNHFLSKIFK
jgi:hypothetical protein